MICQYCNKEHDGTYTTGRFCNSKCAHGFATKLKRQEINAKVSLSLKGKHLKCKNPHSKEQCQNISKSLKALHAERRKIKEAIWNNTPLEEIAKSCKNLRLIRKRLIIERGNKCERCGFNEKHPIWGIPLEPHHRDGNKQNNTLDNLIVVCLNCHFMIDEHYRFRGRKHTSKTKKLLSESLIVNHTPFKNELKHVSM